MNQVQDQGSRRLRQVMEQTAGSGRPALIAYITQGDPSPAETVDIVAAVAAAGADIIELGVPFSDPNADGVVIQEAMHRALSAGGGLASALDSVDSLRSQGCQVPVVLFGYYNPIFIYGIEPFARRAAEVGIDGVLTVDVPIDELDELRAPLAACGLGIVPLVAPTSGIERIARVRELAAPFVYYISLTGVTGAAFRGLSGGRERVAAVREAAGAPVAVGFGIKSPEDACAVGSYADGVVVGSALVQRIADAPPGTAAEAAAQFMGSLRQALDSAR